MVLFIRSSCQVLCLFWNRAILQLFYLLSQLEDLLILSFSQSSDFILKQLVVDTESFVLFVGLNNGWLFLIMKLLNPGFKDFHFPLQLNFPFRGINDLHVHSLECDIGVVPCCENNLGWRPSILFYHHSFQNILRRWGEEARMCLSNFWVICLSVSPICGPIISLVKVEWFLEWVFSPGAPQTHKRVCAFVAKILSFARSVWTFAPAQSNNTLFSIHGNCISFKLE